MLHYQELSPSPSPKTVRPNRLSNFNFTSWYNNPNLNHPFPYASSCPVHWGCSRSGHFCRHMLSQSCSTACQETTSDSSHLGYGLRSTCSSFNKGHLPVVSVCMTCWSISIKATISTCSSGQFPNTNCEAALTSSLAETCKCPYRQVLMPTTRPHQVVSQSPTTKESKRKQARRIK